MVGRRKSTQASKKETAAANKRKGKIAEEYLEVKTGMSKLSKLQTKASK